MTQPFTIIIPAHNEEQTIGKVLNEACKTEASEIIVVDDGSKDKTIRKVKEIKDKRINLISHKVNQGQASAWKTGIAVAKNPILVFFDADIKTVNKNMFEKLVTPIIEAESDYVIGGFENFGRITEFTVKPLLRYFVPSLVSIKQPLSGLFAIRKEFLFPEKIGNRYVTVGILLDAHFAGARTVEVDLGTIEHDKRSNNEKTAQADSECDIFFKKMFEHEILLPARKNTNIIEKFINYRRFLFPFKFNFLRQTI